MRRRDLRELAIYELESEVDSVQFQSIRSLFVEKTSDIVYLTFNKRLYGIICLGDLLHHMRDGKVPIVKNFTKLEGFCDDKAREIFAVKKNIQKIPVIQEWGGVISGDYSRWDDAEKAWIKWIVDQEAVWDKLKKYLKETGYEKIYVISPVTEKSWIEIIILKLFARKKIDVVSIKKEQLKQLLQESEKSLVIVTDEDEWRGIECIDEFDYRTINDRLTWSTFSRLFHEINKYDKHERLNHYSAVKEGDKASNSLKELQEKGVNVLAFYNDVYYLSDYVKKIARRQSHTGKVYGLKKGNFWPSATEIGQEYFGELLENEDYLSGVAQKQILHGHSIHRGNISYSSTYYNVIDGQRKTCFQPEHDCGRIYLFGLCMIMGAYLEDQYTIASQLQKELCDRGFYYRVENLGAYENVFEKMQQVIFHKGDIVIVWTGENTYDGVESADLRKIYEKHDIPAEWCLGTFTHMNHKVARIIAEELYYKIEKYIEKDPKETKGDILFQIQDYSDILGAYIKKTYLDRNFKNREQDEKKIVGCLLTELNTAPEIYNDILHSACLKVDELIVFIPWKPANTKYSFEEYIAVISELALGNDKIKVVSGDGYVPYYNFFQSYYLEEEVSLDQARMDVKIFAQCIARPLHISYRFGVSDQNSRQANPYNEILKAELPKYGIRYVELL